jgi:hypothetical protein
MVLIVDVGEADAVAGSLRAVGEDAWALGDVVAGEGRVRLV